MKFWLLLTVLYTLSLYEARAEDILHININPVSVFLDGDEMKGGWYLLIGEEIDHLDTRAREIVFASDVDTLRIELDDWQTKEFDIVTDKGEIAPVKVRRISENIYENPDPRLLKRAQSGLLSREQAGFDIGALVYGLSEVHPDIFSVCKQEEFFRAVNDAIESLPDSISTMELYRKAAPIVAIIGDGHTNLSFPYNDVFTYELKRMPFYVNVLRDKSIICRASLDSIIPRGAKILSINGESAKSMIDAMLPYVAGEREPFKLSRIDSSFPALRHMLFPADKFEVVYLPVDAKEPLTVTYPATTIEEVRRRSPSLHKEISTEPYSYHIDKTKKVAIMDFREFRDVSKMELFADSMFTELKEEGIDNLIIDLRYNGGGNSRVGDFLLRYISPMPFIQMEKALVRVTPLTKKLMEADDISPMFVFQETPPGNFIKPRTQEEGHYNGCVYILTSNKTFSSAGSFAWTFKECGMGKSNRRGNRRDERMLWRHSGI